MKEKLIFFVIGFFSCIAILATLFFVFLQKQSLRSLEESSEFNLSSKAYLDNAECNNYPYEKIIGNWSGQKTFAKKGELQKWTNYRTADGKYRIEFRFYRNGRLFDEVTEEGLWSYSGCLYTVIVKSVNSSPVLYQEVYRVHELTDSKMKYSNFRTGNEFIMTKQK